MIHLEVPAAQHQARSLPMDTIARGCSNALQHSAKVESLGVFAQLTALTAYVGP
jgi:hypothetical protein